MDAETWFLEDMGPLAWRPIEVTAADGHVFVCDAPGSPHHIAGMKLTGPQTLALASTLHDAMEAIGTPGAHEWPVENAEDHPIWVRAIDGKIHIVGPGPDWPHPAPPRIVVGGFPHALGWMKVLHEAVEALEYQALFADDAA
jgi:hypothetical protein